MEFHNVDFQDTTSKVTTTNAPQDKGARPGKIFLHRELTAEMCGSYDPHGLMLDRERESNQGNSLTRHMYTVQLRPLGAQQIGKQATMVTTCAALETVQLSPATDVHSDKIVFRRWVCWEGTPPNPRSHHC